MKISSILPTIILLILSSTVSANISIFSPKENSDISNQTQLELSYSLRQTVNFDSKVVVFRRNNGQWNRVHEIKLKETRALNRTIKQNITPKNYVCRDTYAIRIMNGEQTLASPVHFTAGAGACSGLRSIFVNLESNQSDISLFKASNQLDRDTCGAFASIAALEAAYKRIQGSRLDLSEHYLHHMIKSTWLKEPATFRYENQSSFWGGNDVETALNFLSSYPVPAENFAPYHSQAMLQFILRQLNLNNLTWSADPRLNTTTQAQIDTFEYSTANIPNAARAMARFGVDEYITHSGIDARNAARIERYLRQGLEVIVGMNLFWADHPTQIKTKILDTQARGAGHIMLIVGFDKTDSDESYFLVKNSYDDGIIRLEYPALINNATTLGVITSVKNPIHSHPSSWIGQWNMRHDQWLGTLKIRRTKEVNIANHTPRFARLGHYIEGHSGDVRCVWGTFSADANQMIAFIDFDSEVVVRNQSVPFGNQNVMALAQNLCPRNPPSSAQRFEVNTRNRASLRRTGTTVWNGMSFPVEIWK